MIEKIKKTYNKYEEIICYLIIGGLTTLVSILVYYLVTSTFLDPNNPLELQIAEVISWILAVLFAYFTNRKYVFKQKEKANLKEGISFFTSRVSTLLVEMLIMYIFVTKLKYNDKVIKIIAQVIVIILNYILSKFIVFKKEK